MKKLNWSYIIVAVIIGLSIIRYGKFNYDIKQQTLVQKGVVLEQEEQEKIDRERNLNACLIRVFDNYETRWNDTCNKRNLGSNCSLPMDLSQSYGDVLEDNESSCIRMYGEK